MWRCTKIGKYQVWWHCDAIICASDQWSCSGGHSYWIMPLINLIILIKQVNILIIIRRSNSQLTGSRGVVTLPGSRVEILRNRSYWSDYSSADNIEQKLFWLYWSKDSPFVCIDQRIKLFWSSAENFEYRDELTRAASQSAAGIAGIIIIIILTF